MRVKKPKNRLLRGLTVFLCIVLSFSSCGNNESGENSQSQGVNEEKEDIALLANVAIKEVLVGNETFSFEGEETSIDWIIRIGNEQFDAPLEKVAVSAVDFDQDGIVEAVVELTDQWNGWVLVLHYDSGEIFGHCYNYRSMQEIYQNGIIAYSNGADDSGFYRLLLDGPAVTEVSAEEEPSTPIQWHRYSVERINTIWAENGQVDLEIDAQQLAYDEACYLLEMGDYEGALALFDTLGDFKDAGRHAEGIRCIDYAEQLRNVLSAEGLTETALLGATITCEYIPEEYTFIKTLTFLDSGLMGWGVSFGSEIGELNYNEIDPDNFKAEAEELYYDYFFQDGYPGIVCKVVLQDEVNEVSLSGTYSGFDDVPATSESGITTLEDIQCYVTERYFVVENGVLLEYTGKKNVVVLPEGIIAIGQDVFAYNETLREIHMPTTLKSVGAGAFFCCGGLETVCLNDGLERIESKAFYNSGIKSISIPNSILSVENEALDYCAHLTDVYYKGSVEEWEAVGVRIYFSPYRPATIHCNDRDLTEADQELLNYH